MLHRPVPPSPTSLSRLLSRLAALSESERSDVLVALAFSEPFVLTQLLNRLEQAARDLAD